MDLLEDDDDELPPPTFEELFTIFSKLADPELDGTEICLTSSNRWMKRAKVLDGKKLRETDTGVAFFKFRRRAISYDNYLIFLQDVCETKGLDIENVKEMMTNIKDPRKFPIKDDQPKQSKSRQAAELEAAQKASVLAILKSYGIKVTQAEESQKNEEKKSVADRGESKS